MELAVVLAAGLGVVGEVTLVGGDDGLLLGGNGGGISSIDDLLDGNGGGISSKPPVVEF